MPEVVCHVMDCIHNRKIRDSFGICKRKTVTIAEINCCIDVIIHPSKKNL